MTMTAEQLAQLRGFLDIPKHTNQHRLSRIVMESHTDELRVMALAVESYTDELIAALEAAEKHITELEARTVTVKLPEYKCSPDMHTKQFYETVGFNAAIDEFKRLNGEE
ncbi:hypothetical protein [Atlantibacter sp. RC6]|uniref:hypothetical protein n=1 Tax=Atlantibacter sp. RC6 TaxID=2587036 RepID=UPI001605DA1B|nr:hypothetical protein [Atlantibacter sp. RC6]MBB3324902.1 hypothetical protein [Atlantibacter sp. RC6]